MCAHPDITLAQLRSAMGEASLLDAQALRDELVLAGVEDWRTLPSDQWRELVRRSYLRLPQMLRPAEIEDHRKPA